MKYIVWLGFLFLSHPMSAQLADSIWLRFEDAVGNKDSVLYGGVYQGDPIPSKYVNSNFNEFNEEFGVGIANFFSNDNIPPQDLIFSKYSIQIWTGIGREFTDWNLIYVRLKHPPVKVSFDKDFFKKFLSRGSWITSDGCVELIPPFGYDGLARFSCLFGLDSIFWDLGTKYMDLDRLPIYREANVKTGKVDTIWGLRHSDLYWWENAMDTPCPYPVSTKDELKDFGIELLRQGDMLKIVNNGDVAIESCAITALTGQILSADKLSINIGDDRDLDMSSSPHEVIILSVTLETGERVSQKLVFIP